MIDANDSAKGGTVFKTAGNAAGGSIHHTLTTSETQAETLRSGTPEVAATARPAKALLTLSGMSFDKKGRP
jgi:hypothetical protein